MSEKKKHTSVRVLARGLFGSGASVTTSDGTPIEGVRSAQVKIYPDELITVEFEIFVSSVDVTAHPLLGLNTVREAAARHGFRLEQED